VRQIPGFVDHDAIGTYPLFVCRDWSQLLLDLEEIQDELVSLGVVTDPFGDYSVTYLRECFQDLVLAFKEHFVVDLSIPIDSVVCKHHRRYTRKAFQELYIEKCDKPEQFLDEWVDLYANLIKMHNIVGISAFSREAFTRQLSLPGVVAFRAVHEDNTVGMLLWCVHKDVGYYHLGAHNSVGYKCRASFALFWFAIEYFMANGIRWLSLGAGAGSENDVNDGLTRFKRGWSTGTRMAYFCGRIFNHTRYSGILREKGMTADDYFPAYRKGEFH